MTRPTPIASTLLFRFPGRLLAITAIAISGLSVTAHAAEAPPEPKALVEKSLAAAGGRDKMLAVKSLKMTAGIEIPLQKIKGTIVMLRKPGNIVTTLQIPGIGKVQTGVSGDIAYEYTDLMGARLLEGPEKKQATDGMDPNALFDRLTELKDATVTGPETVNEAQTWKLTGKNPEGDAETHWFDTKSLQAIKSELIVGSQMGKVKANITYSDFKTIDGLVMPMKVTQSASGMEMVVTIDKIETNIDLPDASFAVPDEVKALANQAKKPTTTQPAQNQP